MKLTKNYIIEGFKLNSNSLIIDYNIIEEKIFLILDLFNKRLKESEGNDLVSYAEKQLKKSGNMDDEYGKMICQSVLELLQTFSNQGHSGFSASATLQFFNKLSKFEPITLVDDPMINQEYDDVSSFYGNNYQGYFQSTILFNMFSDDNGNTWYLNLPEYNYEYCIDDNGELYNVEFCTYYRLPILEFPFNYDTILKEQKIRMYGKLEVIEESSIRIKEAIKKYYHGSNELFELADYKFVEDKFSLLGPGLYAYRDKKSATMYGNIIYSFSTKGLKIADKYFELQEPQIEGIFTLSGIPYTRRDRPMGVTSPLWWDIEGFSFYNVSREKVVKAIYGILRYSPYDGMEIEYPNGGETVVIWNYKKIKDWNINSMKESYIREGVKEKDIDDAFIYLSQITGFQFPVDTFRELVSNSIEQDIPMSLLKNAFQGDNKRRPKADSRLLNPIIVIHTGDNRYVIIDGNHHFLQHEKLGKETIRGIILDIPELKKSKARANMYTYYG